jgi:predicted 3-demethylubiquinone-9 3-methyltransferase (glyoxalase superfamily)
MPKINPCLWFNHQAEDAAEFYTSLFSKSKMGKVARYGDSGAEVSGQKKGTVMTAEFEIDNLKIVGLNGGPLYKFTPAHSFFVWCETEKEIDGLWKKLSEGGEVRMGLDKYPFAEKYGWTSDKFGVEWQLMQLSQSHKIAPAFLFVDKLYGKGGEAIEFYISQFKNSKIEFIANDESTKTVSHCIFSLDGQDFVLMEGEGNHGYTFSPAFSLIVNCQNQEEIDMYWDGLSAGGEPGHCGWLTDKYGVSWQIAPTEMGKLMSDPKKSEVMMKAMLKMGKLDIGKLKKAYEGGGA